jgi:hypothetical protein
MSLRAILTKVTFMGLALCAVDAEAGNLTADCSGWEDSGSWGDCPADVTATAVLERFDSATGAWVTVESSVATIHLDAGASFAIGGSWSSELDGSYRVSLDFAAHVTCGDLDEVWHFEGAYGPYDCAAPPPPPPPSSGNDARTPGYWKNHPESWPVTSLTVGGQSYSQACLLDVFDLATRGDPRIKLIHHLVAAKLNLLPNSIPGIGGTDPSIQPTVDAADQFLIDIGTTIDCTRAALIGPAPSGALSDECISLKDALDAYNNNVEIESSSSALTTTDAEGGCSAVHRSSALEALVLSLFALVVARKRRS